jgi:hypothetical protein
MDYLTTTGFTNGVLRLAKDPMEPKRITAVLSIWGAGLGTPFSGPAVDMCHVGGRLFGFAAGGEWAEGEKFW